MKKRTALNTIPVAPETAPKPDISDAMPVTRIRNVPPARMHTMRRAAAHSVLAWAYDLDGEITDEEKREIREFFPEVELAAMERSVGKRFWPFFLDELSKTYPD